MELNKDMLYEGGAWLGEFLRVLCEADMDRFENSALTTKEHNWYGCFVTRPFSPGASILMAPEVWK